MLEAKEELSGQSRFKKGERGKGPDVKKFPTLQLAQVTREMGRYVDGYCLLKYDANSRVFNSAFLCQALFYAASTYHFILSL